MKAGSCPHCSLVRLKAWLIAGTGIILAFLALMALLDDMADGWLWTFVVLLGAAQLFALMWLVAGEW